MADTANIATCGEGNPFKVKTGNTPRDVRDNRDVSALQASGPDAAILSAWASYLAMRDTLDALPDDKESVDEQFAFEAPYWAECDKAEMTILETEATTPAGIAVKIKIALAHMLTQRTHDNALRRGDLATLADPELDWDMLRRDGFLPARGDYRPRELTAAERDAIARAEAERERVKAEAHAKAAQIARQRLAGARPADPGIQPIPQAHRARGALAGRKLAAGAYDRS